MYTCPGKAGYNILRDHNSYEIHVDECRYLILKIIEQAVRDFVNLERSVAPIDKYFYETAVAFLFDDDYRIQWGEEEVGLAHMMEFLGLDIDWAREKAVLAKQRKLKDFEMRKALRNE